MLNLNKFFKEFGLKPKNIVLGVSGGVDSMVLLDLLRGLRDELGFSLIVAHVDHGLREDSYLDRVLVQEKCSQYGVRFSLKKLKAPSSNIEAWGREERYSFFNELSAGLDDCYILTAHHLDDYVETFLFRLFTGRINNLGSPMKKVDEVRRILRPLLDFPKQELVFYAEQNGISFREDKTNFDQGYRRNFIRHSIIPLIQEFESTYQSQVKGYLGEVSLLEDYLEKEAGRFMQTDLSGLRDLPEVLLSRILYQKAALVDKDNAAKISRERIRALIKIIQEGANHSRICELGFGLSAEVQNALKKSASVSFFRA